MVTHSRLAHTQTQVAELELCSPHGSMHDIAMSNSRVPLIIWDGIYRAI